MKKLAISAMMACMLGLFTVTAEATEVVPPAGTVYVDGVDAPQPGMGHVRVSGVYPLIICGTQVGEIAYDYPVACFTDKKGKFVLKEEQSVYKSTELRVDAQAMLSLNKTIVLPGKRGSYHLPYFVWHRALLAARAEFESLFKKMPYAFADCVYAANGQRIEMKEKSLMYAAVDAKLCAAMMNALHRSIVDDKEGTPNYSAYKAGDIVQLKDVVLPALLVDNTSVAGSALTRMQAYRQFKDLKLNGNASRCGFCKLAQQHADLFLLHVEQSFHSKK